MSEIIGAVDAWDDLADKNYQRVEVMHIKTKSGSEYDRFYGVDGGGKRRIVKNIYNGDAEARLQAEEDFLNGYDHSLDERIVYGINPRAYRDNPKIIENWLEVKAKQDAGETVGELKRPDGPHPVIQAYERLGQSKNPETKPGFKDRFLGRIALVPGRIVEKLSTPRRQPEVSEEQSIEIETKEKRRRSRVLIGALGGAALLGAGTLLGFWLHGKTGYNLHEDIQNLQLDIDQFKAEIIHDINQNKDVTQSGIQHLSEQSTKHTNEVLDTMTQQHAHINQHHHHIGETLNAISDKISHVSDSVEKLNAHEQAEALSSIKTDTIKAPDADQLVRGSLDLIHRQGFEISGDTPARISALAERIKDWDIAVGMKAGGVQNIVDIRQNLGSDGLFSNHAASGAVGFKSPQQLHELAKIAQNLGMDFKKAA